jgi:hypothetical protein
MIDGGCDQTFYQARDIQKWVMDNLTGKISSRQNWSFTFVVTIGILSHRRNNFIFNQFFGQIRLLVLELSFWWKR